MNRAASLVSGVGLLLAAGAVTGAASLLPEAGSTPVPAAQVPVEAGDAVLACPAPPRLVDLDGEPATDSAFAADPAETHTSAAAVALAGAAAPTLTVTGPDGPVDGRAAGSVVRADAPAGAAFTARAVPAAGSVPQLAAVRSALTPRGDLRGLAASGCAAPAESTWLVGGATVVGHSGRLTLTNAGATPATVDVDVVTPDGTVSPAAGQHVVLAPGEVREVLLEGLVADAPAVAVHVAATGGRVAATLVDTAVEGLTPRGVEVVAPGTGPAPRQVLPGVVVAEGAGAPVLRVATPGAEDAVVRWRLLGPTGQVAPSGSAAATVPAGTVADLPLEGLPPGSYTVVVDADVPVVAGAASSSGGGSAGTDVSWAPSVPALGGDSFVALPASDDIAAVLVLSADAEGADDSAADVAVTAVDAAGSAVGQTRVPVATGATTRVDVDALAPDGAVALVVTPAEGAGGVYGAVELTARVSGVGDGISLLPVRSEPTAPADVTVRTVRGGRWP